MTIDMGQLAREVELPVEQVQAAVELLDAGNSVPFVARFRRDATGGLDEPQVRRIHAALVERRNLAERKEAVLRAIESHGKLSDDLKQKIEQTWSLRRLEDLFLPYKPKKQTLGSLAKDRGLEPLAREILHASPAAANLDARAADFVSPDRELANAAEVLLGVGHLMAEHFSEHAEARSQLRRTFWRTARIACKPGEAVDELKDLDRQAQVEHEAMKHAAESQRRQDVPAVAEESPSDAAPATESSNVEAGAPAPTDDASEHVAVEQVGEAEVSEPVGELPVAAEAVGGEPGANVEPDGAQTTELAPAGESHPPATHGAVAEHVATIAAAAKGIKAPVKAIAAQAVSRKKAKDQVKRRKRQKAVQTFRDFFESREAIKQLTPQRILSLNRGERLRVLELNIEADLPAMQKQAEEVLVPADHPHGDFLRACARDAVARIVIPSLVAEARRELNDKGESYAIEIFAQNLRHVLLQKPIRGRRVLAIEPGYRKGCKIAAVDEAGRVLGVGMLQVVGREDWRKKGRERLVEIIRKHNVSIVVVGDGPGSREVERLVTDVLEHDLKGAGVEYTVAPEAGAAAYGMSPLAREELSKYDPSHRIAISIARRLLDPLAELVKVGPANIEVGPSHYDIKTKLLRDTLDSVVESVVSQVGVDVNRANPALLRYIPGMNQLTARRLYEFREHYGPLRNREQLKDIPGIDEKIFRQAAGFMKITGGENPLDATWIHPEHYGDARKVLDTLGFAIENVAPPPPKPKAFAEDVMSETPAAEVAAEAPPVATFEARQAEVPSSEPVAETSPPQDSPAQVDVAVAGDAVSVAASGELPAEAVAVETLPPAAETPPPATVEVAASAPPAAHAPVEVEEPRHNEEFERRAAGWDLDQKSSELGIGKFTLRHILAELAKPGRDPRENLAAPMLRSHRMSLDDVQPKMELKGIVVSVVDFGAFVDVGLPESGLVHISRLANRFVRDAHDEVAVGDAIQVWVVEVDKNRGRVSLTAVEPGTERPREGREQRPKKEPQPQKARSEGQGQGQSRGGGDRPPRRQNRDQGKKGGGRAAPRQPSVYVVQSKKPAKPISKKMIEGKEPLRSFSDLQQFMKKKTEDGSEEEQK